MKTLKFQMLPNELWWGGSVAYALKQPFDLTTNIKLNVEETGENQSAPFFISSMGRYIWDDSPIRSIEFNDGTVTLDGTNPVLVKAGDCLKDAYFDAMRNHFPFEDKELPEIFFRTAQYNTWMEFTYYPTQQSVLNYAHAIVDNGYKPGVLMIDEGWHIGYGTWEFDFHKFPNPKAMVDELHELGFKVMLWVVPYVTPDGRDFLDHKDKWICDIMGKPFEPRLLRQPNGEVAILKWWNGYSAVLNLCEEADRKYLDSKLLHLINDYGVDGFKFDGGNIASFSKHLWMTPPPEKTAEELNLAWNEFGAKYTYHEYKDTYNKGGKATIQRICDRAHSWGDNGLGSLIPTALMQGLLGYPYLCPDMIGGGSWAPTVDPNFKCDEELFVRMAQCSALFPMMQFSWAPWRVLSKESQELCLKASKLHDKFASIIVELVKKARKTGAPILQMMEFYAPHKGYARITDQFMLGDSILVCPVIQKGVRVRKAVLPSGTWEYCDGTIYQGDTVVEVSAPLDTLPYFRKI
ncbi:MAG: glycoside hydrolase [Clostridia bacterium]|nr:glycoside hydrolase [Clostridia bacterium]